MDESIIEQLRKDGVLDAAIIQHLDLTPEKFMGVSAVLQAFNWLKAIAKEENRPIESMDRKFIIKKLLDIDICDGEINKASAELIARELQIKNL